MTAADCLSGPGPLRLALTLVHFLWQGLAVAALTALAVRAMALRAGPPRYAAYLTALLALAACPVVTFLLVEPPVAPHTLPAEAAGLSDTADGLPASSASGPWQAVGGADVPAGQPSAPTGGPYTHAPIAPPLAAAARAVSPPPAAPPATEDSVGARLLHAVSPALPWITAAWIAGVCALSLRLCAGAIGTLRWRRQLVESPPALRPMLAELAQRMGLPGFARVFLSPRAPQPIVVG
ncbi:MAG: hypothetical protein NT031_17965, partial [Planctomycetota bacterium]|nr:hypothetical protein [Planctomycetota bacterium]